MKILLADDHQLFLEGMQSVLASLSPDTHITCENNGNDALKQLSDSSFDIALIDLRLPSINGFSLLKELSTTNCLTPVIIVTASEDPQDIQQAIDLGAMGFVPKSSTGQQIIQAIELVLMGEVVKPDHLYQHHATTDDKPDWASQHNLTHRQLEVLRLIGHGLSNQAIADKLFLSIATVKTHIVAIFQALNTQNRTEAIKKAHQLGLD
ncbi:MAG: response regulator [Methyloprofundus sp.]|nr:response regulator [Methyloprofundus sp.]